MNAIDILKKDHEKLITIMASLEAATDTKQEDCKELFQQFKHLFDIHDKAEDDIFYPALKEHNELTKLINKGYQAHHMVEVAILELKLVPYTSESWAPKFSVTKDCILAHMHEEERILFPKARSLLEEKELEKLGREIEASRKE